MIEGILITIVLILLLAYPAAKLAALGWFGEKLNYQRKFLRAVETEKADGEPS